jgi:hypothetical protein
LIALIKEDEIERDHGKQYGGREKTTLSLFGKKKTFVLKGANNLSLTPSIFFIIRIYANLCTKKGKKSPEILSWREKSEQNLCMMHATIWVIFLSFPLGWQEWRGIKTKLL